MMRARLPVLILLACSGATAAAQNNASAPAPRAGDELKNIQQLLEQQSQQIDVLAQEVARLNLLLEGREGGGGMAPLPPPAAAAPAAETALKALAAPEPPASAAAPAGSGLTHEVAKGETLTSIAKHYKVTVGELLKVNKIADVKKLQIGQLVNLPPDAKPPETTPPATASPAPSTK